MTQIYNVLVLCTGNSARSIMAEALFNTLGKNRFRAYSAGSHPAGQVNPYAIEQLKTVGYPTEHLRSKNWSEFAQPNAPKMDFIITVCDNAANEVCPIWPGQPISAHWGFKDPAAVEGSDEDKRQAFQEIFQQISHRVSVFLSLPIMTLDKTSLQREMKAIGEAAV